jgi:endonuclease-3
MAKKTKASTSPPRKKPTAKRFSKSKKESTDSNKVTTAPEKKASPKVVALSKQRQRASEMIAILKRYYPNAHCALNHDSPFQLLVATILSAQCTDARVNQVTPVLFAKYPTPKAMAQAPVEAIEDIIRSTGFFRNKARNIKACCQSLHTLYGGNVPQNMKELSNLAGVGRKTANVVLGNAFNIPGLVVDTHVTRLSHRLGLAKPQNAVQIEKELMALIAKEDWVVFSHLLIQHGRTTCKARRPQCSVCFLAQLCPSCGNF